MALVTPAATLQLLPAVIPRGGRTPPVQVVRPSPRPRVEGGHDASGHDAASLTVMAARPEARFRRRVPFCGIPP